MANPVERNKYKEMHELVCSAYSPLEFEQLMRGCAFPEELFLALPPAATAAPNQYIGAALEAVRRRGLVDEGLFMAIATHRPAFRQQVADVAALWGSELGTIDADERKIALNIALQPFPLKYYVYISHTKLSMLCNQMPEVPFNLPAELKVDAVRRRIEATTRVGSLDSETPYFKGEFYASNLIYNSFTFFGGQEEREPQERAPALGLSCSTKNLVGAVYRNLRPAHEYKTFDRVGPADTAIVDLCSSNVEFCYSLSRIDSRTQKWYREEGRLERYLLSNRQNRVKQWLGLRLLGMNRWLECKTSLFTESHEVAEEQLLHDVMSHAIYGSGRQRYEYFARRLLHRRVDGRLVVLASPLYVALASEGQTGI